MQHIYSRPIIKTAHTREECVNTSELPAWLWSSWVWSTEMRTVAALMPGGTHYMHTHTPAVGYNPETHISTFTHRAIQNLIWGFEVLLDPGVNMQRKDIHQCWTDLGSNTTQNYFKYVVIWASLSFPGSMEPIEQSQERKPWTSFTPGSIGQNLQVFEIFQMVFEPRSGVLACIPILFRLSCECWCHGAWYWVTLSGCVLKRQKSLWYSGSSELWWL